MDIKLYQNCIFEADFNSLSEGFEGLDVTQNSRPWLREFQVFQELYNEGIHLNHDILGAVSINFERKSKLNGVQVRAWIENNPGYDVYVVNPFPQFAYCHFNLWQFSDNRCTFPFTEYSIRSLEECQVESLVNPDKRQSNNLLATCSYWFGNKTFWEKYLKEVVIKVVDTDPSRLSAEVHDFLYKPTYYYASPGVPVGNIAFLLERTLSEFIDREKSLKSLFFPVDEDRLLRCCLFNFEREIVLENFRYVDDLDQKKDVLELREYFRKTSPIAAQKWVKNFEEMGRKKVYSEGNTST
ncbi:MAG: hypothetical protein DCF32_02970 [Leptolyngbya sp.]|nr:MAG: hypothetical protein DCF32_02970 [Leptolyngbya sp.]